jgi:hypothetical protein
LNEELQRTAGLGTNKKQMTHKILVLSILISLVSCYNVEHNCKDFKTGKFEFVQEIEGKKNISTFERTHDLQIETYNGKVDSASIRWVNDCEFVLQKLHPKNMLEKKAISIRILSTSKKTYQFEYSFVGDAKKQKGSVTKID